MRGHAARRTPHAALTPAATQPAAAHLRLICRGITRNLAWFSYHIQRTRSITGTRQRPARTLLLLQRGLGRVLGRAAAAVPVRASLAPAAAGDGRRQRLRQAPLRQQRKLPRVQVRLRGGLPRVDSRVRVEHTASRPCGKHAGAAGNAESCVPTQCPARHARMHGRRQRARCVLSRTYVQSVNVALHVKGRLSRARRRTTDCFSFSLKQCRQVKRSSLNSDLRRAGARARVRPACLMLTHRCGDARLRLLACFE